MLPTNENTIGQKPNRKLSQKRTQIQNILKTYLLKRTTTFRSSSSKNHQKKGGRKELSYIN